MKKILLCTIVVLLNSVCYSQDTTKATGQKLAAALKKSIERQLVTDLAAKNFGGLMPKSSMAGSTADLIKAADDAQKATYNDAKRMISFISASFNVTFSLSSSFAGLAANMQILEPKEAEKVNLAVINANNTWRYISGGIALAGTAFTATQLLGNSGMSNKTSLSINMAALVPLIINSFSGSGNSGNTEASSQINNAITSAATYAYQKGQRLAVHAFLSVEVNKVTGKLDALQKQSADIYNNVKNATTKDEITNYATLLNSLIDETNTFFSSTILNMQSAIKEHSTIDLYDENTKKRLKDLSTQVTAALASWNNMKTEYKNHQVLLNSAIAGI